MRSRLNVSPDWLEAAETLPHKSINSIKISWAAFMQCEGAQFGIASPIVYRRGAELMKCLAGRNTELSKPDCRMRLRGNCCASSILVPQVSLTNSESDVSAAIPQS